VLNGAPPRLAGWPARFKEAGYHTAGVGRVGLIAEQLHKACVVCDVDATDDRRCAFLEHATAEGFLGSVQERREHRRRCGPFDTDPGRMFPVEHDADGFIADRAAAMIAQLPRDRPWVMIVAFTGPGNDMPAPSAHRHAIDTHALTDRFVPVDLSAIDAYAELDYPRTLLQKLSGASIAGIRADYLGRVTQIDQAVGRLREAVDRHGHAPRTWIVHTADHGKLLGERGLVGHRSFLAPAVYVPLWILPPRGRGELGEAVKSETYEPDGLVSGVDLAATLCAIGAVDSPPGCAGQSILPGVHGRGVGGEAAISEFGGRLMLETLRYKVAFDIATARPRLLFDLLRDPEERTDLLHTEVSANVLDMLRWQLGQSLLPLRAAGV